MIFNDIFNHIYVINLKKCTDRKEHIEKEFNRVGIVNYEFFEATPHDSIDSINLYNGPFVKKFPNCFRCGLKRCSCENNYLTPFQIANWHSFIRVFTDIINNKYNFVLICEDDIVFSHQYKRIIDKLLSKQNFKNYRIDMNKPLLIRLGTAFNPSNHNSRDEPMFIKNYSLCNPCFAINKHMALIYLKYLKIIDYHSDVYIHQKIPKNIKGIQFFTMYPYPIYELSFVKSKQKFESVVRPNNGIRRLEYKEFLFISSNFLLHLFLVKMILSLKLPLSIGIHKMGYNGNIDYYLLMNEHDQQKYYFENKILIFDSEENNKTIFHKYKHLDLYKKYNNDIDLFYEFYDKLLNDDKIIKIDINNIQSNFILKNLVKENKLMSLLNEYNELKKTI